jgi:hypothetical protein
VKESLSTEDKGSKDRETTLISCLASLAEKEEAWWSMFCIVMEKGLAGMEELMLSCGPNVIMWNQMLSSIGLILYHVEQMLSCGPNVIMWK